MVPSNSGNSLNYLQGRNLNGYRIYAPNNVGTQPVEAVCADFNGDGHMDAASANTGSNDVSVIFGNGDGTFATAISYGVGVRPASKAVDFDNDGILDIVVIHETSTFVRVLFGISDGSFSSGTDTDIGNGMSQCDVEDLNGDGLKDLAVTRYGSSVVTIMFQQFDGSFNVVSTRDEGNTELVMIIGIQNQNHFCIDKCEF